MLCRKSSICAGSALRQGAHARDGFLTRHHPVIQQCRVIDQERRHAETGGIADADAAAQIGFDGDGRVATTRGGDVLDQVERKGTGQPHRQHFGLERAADFGAIGDGQAIGGAELAGTVDRGGAHQVTDRFELFTIGLLARCQRVDNVLPQAHRAVGARQRQLRVGNTPGFLFRHILFEAIEIRCVRNTVVTVQRWHPRRWR